MGEMVEDRTNGGDCNLKMWEMGQAGIWGAAQELEKKDMELTRGIEGDGNQCGAKLWLNSFEFYEHFC